MNDSQALTVEVAEDLKQPLEMLAGDLRQSPNWIVNRALEEYLERRRRRDHAAGLSGNPANYIELTTREGRFDML